MVRENDPSYVKTAQIRAIPLRIALTMCVLALVVPSRSRAEGPAKRPTPTFTRDVAPILQKRCQNCHRAKHVGPFPLVTFAQAHKRADDIAAVASDRSMPPWKPARGVGPKLKHDQSLPREEIRILEAWADAGAPEGDLAHMPPPKEAAPDWPLGPPDVVLEAADSYKVPAAGPDLYRCFVIPTELARDGYFSAVDFRPGNRRVVHHISAYLDMTGAGRARDKAEPGAGYVSFSGPGIEIFSELSFWAAGHEPSRLPDGIGYHIPRQADIILQVHYHPTGKDEEDRPRVGLYFARKPVRQALHWNTAQNMDFEIPAGNPKVEIKATWYVPVDLEALAVSPHMHSLGRQMRMSVTYPNGKTNDLIYIPEWDPAWQSAYFFQKPINLPRGSIVKVSAYFDNSAHARNPNSPPKAVQWGPGVDAEMCEGFIAVVKKGQDLTQPRAVDDLTLIFAQQRSRNQLKQFFRKTR